VTYTIRNLCDDCIFSIITLIDDQVKNFYISGELRSKIDIMPLDSVDLEFTMVPLFIGSHHLPKLYVLDRNIFPDAKELTAKKIKDNKTTKPEEKPLEFLVKGFTHKVMVEH
jgi:hypothetical protein